MSQSLGHQLSEATLRLRNLIFDSQKSNNFEYLDCDSDLNIPNIKSLYNDLKKPFNLPFPKVEIPNFTPSELLLYKGGYVSVIHDTPPTMEVKSPDKQFRANHVYESRTSVDDVIDFVVTKYSMHNELVTNFEEEEWISKKKRKKKKCREKEPRRLKPEESAMEFIVEKKLQSEDVSIFESKISWHSAANNTKESIIDVDRGSINTVTVKYKSEISVDSSVQENEAKQEKTTRKEGIGSILFESEKCQSEEIKVDQVRRNMQDLAENVLSIVVDNNSLLPINIQDERSNEPKTVTEELPCVLNYRTSGDDALDSLVAKCCSPIELGTDVDTEKGNLQKRKKPKEVLIVNNLPESKLKKSLNEEFPFDPTRIDPHLNECQKGLGGEDVSLIIDKSIAQMEEKLCDKDLSDVECKPICLQANSDDEHKFTVMMLEESKPKESRANEVLSDLREFAEKAFTQVHANESSVEFELDLSDKAKGENIEVERKQKLNTVIIRDSTGIEEIESTPKPSSFQSVANVESCSIISNFLPLVNDCNIVSQSEAVLKDNAIEDQSVKTEISCLYNSVTLSVVAETQETKENAELEEHGKLNTVIIPDKFDVGKIQVLVDRKSSMEFPVNSSKSAVSEFNSVYPKKSVSKDGTTEDQSGRVETDNKLVAKDVTLLAETEEAKENRELNYCLELVEASLDLKKELSSICGLNSTATCGMLPKKSLLQEVKYLLSCKVKLQQLSKSHVKKYTKKQVNSVSTPLGRLEKELFQYSVEGEALSSDDSFEKKEIKRPGINEDLKLKKEDLDTKKKGFNGRSEDLGSKKDSKSKDWKRIMPNNDFEIRRKKNEKIGLEKKRLVDETLSKIYGTANEFKAFKIPKEPTPKKINQKASILSKPEKKHPLSKKEYKLLKSDKDPESEKLSPKNVPVNVVSPLRKGNLEKGKQNHLDSNKRKELSNMINYEKPRNALESNRFIGENLKDNLTFFGNAQNMKGKKYSPNITLNNKFSKDTHIDHPLAILPKHELHGQQAKNSSSDSKKTNSLVGDGHYEDYDFDYLEEKLSACLGIPFIQEKEDKLQQRVRHKHAEVGTSAGHRIKNQSVNRADSKEITGFKGKSQNRKCIVELDATIPSSSVNILLKERELPPDLKIPSKDQDGPFKAIENALGPVGSNLFQIASENEKVYQVQQPLCDNLRPTKKRRTLLLDPCVVLEAASEANLTTRSSDWMKGSGNSSCLRSTKNSAYTQVNNLNVRCSSAVNDIIAKLPQDRENTNFACNKLISMLKFPTNGGNPATLTEKKDVSDTQLPDNVDSVNEKCCAWITERVPCEDIQDLHDPEAMDEELEKDDGDLFSVLSSSLSISASRVGQIDEEDGSKKETYLSGSKECSETGTSVKTSDFSRFETPTPSQYESEILRKAQEKLALLDFDSYKTTEDEEDLEAVEALFQMVEDCGKQGEPKTKESPESILSSDVKNDSSSILQVQSQYAAYHYAAYLQNYYKQLQAVGYVSPWLQAHNSSHSSAMSYPANISGTKSTTGPSVSAQINVAHSSSATNAPNPSFMPLPPN